MSENPILRILLFFAFIMTPSVLSYTFTKRLVVSFVFFIANLTVLTFRPFRKPTLGNTLVMTLLYIEALLILHSMELASDPQGIDPALLAPGNNLDADKPSFGYLSVPFVSLVLIGGEAMQAKWRDEAPPSLIKEVIVHGESEPQGEFTIFVNTGADAVGENLIAFLVREIMNTGENDKVVFVPSVAVDGHEYSHAVLDGAKLRRFDEPKLSKVWVVPEISAFVVRTKFISLVQGLAAGDQVEGSLDVWRCGGTIKLATLAKMRVNSVMPKQTITSSSCAAEISDETMAEMFSDYMPPVKTYKLAFGSRCLTYNNSLTVGISQCKENDQNQLFGSFDDGRALRSAGSCAAENSSPSCLCLDAGSNPTEGQSVNFYFCRPETVSQQLEIFGSRLMWGSFCVNSDLKLQHCEGRNLDVAVL